MSLAHVPGEGAPGDFEHPNENMRRRVIIALYFAFILSTVAVGLRLLARRLAGTGLHLDDYLIVVALLFKYGCSAMVAILLFNGMGSHITMIPPKNLTIYLKLGWANPFVYTTCVALIKLSILALYKRLFQTRRMALAVKAVACFVILWALSIYIVSIVQCIPVRKFWDPTVEGSCIDQARFFYGMQIPNIVSDLALLILPLKPVWGLPIPKVERMLLSLVFLVGILTLAFDIVRLVAMIQMTTAGPDLTYNQVPFAVWTCTEAAVGITAACMSTWRPLFRLGKREFWSWARSSSGQSKQPLQGDQSSEDSYWCAETGQSGVQTQCSAAKA